MHSKLVPPSVNLASELHRLGVKGQITVVLSSESDGKALESAIAGKVNADYVPYDPQIGQAQRTVKIGGLTFVWPSPAPAE